MLRVEKDELRSHPVRYVELAQSGTDVEITEHNIPVARIVGVARISLVCVTTATGEAHRILKNNEASWIEEAAQLGLVTLPSDTTGFASDFFDKKNMPPGKEVLKALLDEREEGK